MAGMFPYKKSVIRMNIGGPLYTVSALIMALLQNVVRIPVDNISTRGPWVLLNS